MKGLLLTHLGRREEGLELVKQGVRLDLTSHICWHVFGLIQKGQKNYEEALKSYTQALRFDKVRVPSYSAYLSIYAPPWCTEGTTTYVLECVRLNFLCTTRSPRTIKVLCHRYTRGITHVTPGYIHTTLLSFP